MNKEDNETLKYFKKVYDELMQDEKYQKYASLMDFYHKKVENLQHQLEEKDKIINKVSERLKLLGKYDGKTCTRNFKMMSADFNQLLEILERGEDND